MSGEEQRAVLEFARARGIWIVADEVYARIVYDRTVAPSFLEQALPEDRLIVVNSFSKSWAMTGWRLGWITLPAALAPTFEMLTEYNIAGPAGFIQRAGVVAVRDGEPFVREIALRYRAARDLVSERIGALPRLSLAPPAAAFYAFIRVDGLRDSLAFAKELLAATGVGLAPGAAFGEGGEGHLRLCFAATLSTLENGPGPLRGLHGDALTAPRAGRQPCSRIEGSCSEAAQRARTAANCPPAIPNSHEVACWLLASVRRPQATDS